MKNIVVVLESFGFKYGMPAIMDYMVDARFITNPFYVPELKNLSGNDPSVKDYIDKQLRTGEFIKFLVQLVECVVQKFEEAGKMQVTIGVGCTGGRHRSVYVANALAAQLASAGYETKVNHRDVDK